MVVLVLVLLLSGLATLWVARSVAEVLPDVGRDHLGDDAWTDPLGLYVPAGFQVARIPDCAAGSLTRMVLWDADSNPYWEVSGPPTRMSQFVVGAEPEGFTTDVAYRDPPPDVMLRLVAFRRNGGPVGIRYTNEDLSETRVLAGEPLRRYTPSGFQGASVCGTSDVGVDDDGIVRPDLAPPGAEDAPTPTPDPQPDPGDEREDPIDPDPGDEPVLDGDEDFEELDYEELIEDPDG